MQEQATLQIITKLGKKDSDYSSALNKERLKVSYERKESEKIL